MNQLETVGERFARFSAMVNSHQSTLEDFGKNIIEASRIIHGNGYSEDKRYFKFIQSRLGTYTAARIARHNGFSLDDCLLWVRS